MQRMTKLALALAVTGGAALLSTQPAQASPREAAALASSQTVAYHGGYYSGYRPGFGFSIQIGPRPYYGGYGYGYQPYYGRSYYRPYYYHRGHGYHYDRGHYGHGHHHHHH